MIPGHVPPTPVVRHCPLCGIAMQASKTREDLTHYDTFRCLTCHTTIVEAAPAPSGTGKPGGPR